MIDKKHLLNSRQMAEFVARGFLRFDELVPDDINQAVMQDIDSNAIQGAPAGTPLSQCYGGTAIRAMLDLPPIRGLIHSLVGADPLFDHDAIHVREPNEGRAQGLHADSIIDLRTHFDIQIMYFPHDVPLEMGGTLLLPGSHFRRVNEMDIAAYQNMRGQIPMVCKAGSILALHHGIWHCGRQNKTNRRRYMFKLRLNPAERQPLPPRQRNGHRRLSEYARANPDGLQGGFDSGAASWHLALRPPKQDQPPPLYVQAAAEPGRTAAAPLEH